MTEEPGELSSTTSDLSAVIKTSSRGAEFYSCAVVLIGVVGTAANALILYAMVVSDQHKKHLLIFNQNATDLCASVFLVITYALRLCKIYLTGTLGYWLCMLFLGDSLVWCSTDASVVNLLSVTVERYMKVVHPTRAKKLLSEGLMYSVVVFIWIGTFAYNMALPFMTSGVIDGVCHGVHGVQFWKSPVAAILFTIWYFVTFLVVVVVVTVFCYGRILLVINNVCSTLMSLIYGRILFVIRRQASVMAGHSADTGSITAHAQTQSQQIQSNVIKTMMLVSSFYVVAWMPIRLYHLILSLNTRIAVDRNVYYVTMFVAFLYICANPFIYAIKFNPVKRVLLDLIPCKRSQPQQAAEGGSVDASGTRTVQTRVLQAGAR